MSDYLFLPMRNKIHLVYKGKVEHVLFDDCVYDGDSYFKQHMSYIYGYALIE